MTIGSTGVALSSQCTMHWIYNSSDWGLQWTDMHIQSSVNILEHYLHIARWLRLTCCVLFGSLSAVEQDCQQDLSHWNTIYHLPFTIYTIYYVPLRDLVYPQSISTHKYNFVEASIKACHRNHCQASAGCPVNISLGKAVFWWIQI